MSKFPDKIYVKVSKKEIQAEKDETPGSIEYIKSKYVKKIIKDIIFDLHVDMNAIKGFSWYTYDIPVKDLQKGTIKTKIDTLKLLKKELRL